MNDCLLNEQTFSKIRSINIKERKRALALANIFKNMSDWEECKNNEEKSILKTFNYNINNWIIDNQKLINSDKKFRNDFFPILLINSEIRINDTFDLKVLEYLKYYNYHKNQIKEDKFKIQLIFKFKENPFFHNKWLNIKATYINLDIKKSKGTKILWKTNIDSTIDYNSYSFFNIFNNYNEKDSIKEEDLESWNCDLEIIDESITTIKLILIKGMLNYIKYLNNFNNKNNCKIQ